MTTSTNNIVFQENFYHKTSMLKLQLGTYLDKTKFRLEVAPAKESNARVRSYNYDESVNMVFDVNEVMRIKKIIENLMNPQKTQEAYEIPHFFEDEGGKKVGSCLHFSRKPKNAIQYNDPKKEEQAKKQDAYKYNVIIIMTINSKGKSHSFGFTDEEVYMFINLIPFWCNQFIEEKSRVSKIVWQNKKGEGGGQKSAPPAQQQRSYTPEPPQEPAGAQSPEFPDLDDVPF